MQLSAPSRPLVSRRALGAWLVLLATLPFGLRSYHRSDRIGIGTWNPGELMGVNYRTYHYAAERARDGQPFYDAPPPDTYSWAVYLYPPGTLPGFYPFSVFDWTTGYAALTLLSVLAAGAATWLLVRHVESLGPQLGWVDVGLVFVVFLLSTHAFGTIFFGNINILLALGLVVGLWALARERESLAGASFALTALFKLFPALIGLWLLRTRRWRATAAAILTGLGGLLLGVLLYGLEPTRYYFTEVVTGRSEAELFVGGYPVGSTFYVTIQRPVSHVVAAVWPSAPYLVIVGVSVLVCAGVLAYFYRDLETELDRQMAVFATVVVMVVIVPSLHWYLVFLFVPMVILLYLWREGPGRYLFLAGGVLSSVTGTTADTLHYLGKAPDLLESVGRPIAIAATPHMYGILLMLVACGWHKYRRDTGQSRGSSIRMP